ncbi:MAG: LysR substrate-binding domain-containing protein [Bacteroidota bacterium]
MNFQQLSYIIAVDRHQNFHRAAVDCDVAQSTLSKEIQRLEQEYGIIIFDRTRQPVVPTLKGVDLINKAREILQKRREFVHIAQRRDNPVAGHMKLALTEILAPYLAPFLIRSLSRKYPDLHLEILELSDRRIEDLLTDEGIDAAVMISPSLAKEYFEHTLYREQLLLYSPELSPTRGDGTVAVGDIDFGSVLIHEDLKEILLRQLGSLFGDYAPEEGRNIKYLKGNLETIRHIIRTNGGAMLVPTLARSFFPEHEQRHLFAFRGVHPELDVSLISSRGFEKTRIIKRLIEEIGQIVPAPVAGA